jgi:amino acid adenylation domain-containing protein/non-ribosomal peptide synthase protein (TIGR01720 family)
MNTPSSKLELQGLRVEEYLLGSRRSIVDVTLQIEENEEGISGFFEYSSDLFFKETIQRISNQFQLLLEEFINGEDRKIDEISILSYKERNLILNKFNNTYIEYPKDKTIVDLFEEQVDKTPDNIAVVYDKQKLTYRELNEKANMLALRLREIGVKPDDFVGIATERSLEMIVGIYGIIKSGGAYVPMDPEYPEDRISYMISDCKPKVIVTYKADIKAGDIPIINLGDQKIFKDKVENLEKVNKSRDLLYVIYTSGSTGKPKGVMVEHRNVINLTGGIYEFLYSKFKKSINVALIASYAFDASIQQIFTPLLYGHSLYITNDEIRTNGYELIEFYIKNNIKVSDGTPIHLKILSEENSFSKVNVDTFIIGGEALENSIVRKLGQLNENVEIINVYGPTETTVDVTQYPCENNDNFLWEPIGRPINNVKIYIINGSTLCGVGMPGELCIAGDGLSRGYLNKPELTKEKFISNPYGEGRLYRTGDLARWLPDGNIEYLGRIDEQVKIRGFRIELGEIENVLRSIDCIKDAAVIAKKDASRDKAIYAYVVCDAKEYRKLNMSEIREEIRKKLPDYMVPAYMMQIEEIPVTMNGKLDKKSLPDIKEELMEEYIAPRNEKEKIICDVFEQILGRDKIGINESFFNLGGDSIKAIRVVSKVRNMGYKVTVKDVMGQKTASLIAKQLKKVVGTEYEQGEITGEILDTPIVKWFKEKNLSKSSHFNQAIMVKVEKTHKTEMKKSIEAVIKYHDILRAVYKEERLKITATDKAELYSYQEYNVASMMGQELEQYLEKKCNEIQSDIDLINGPLVKIALFITGKEDHLLLCIHHLVIDGVSWRILLEDLESAYEQSLEGKDIQLPQKTASYKMWAELIGEYAISNKIKEEIGYWEEIKEKMKQGMILTQKNEPYQIKSERMLLDKENTALLTHEAGKSYGTEINDLLLSALVIAVNKLTGQKYLSLELEGHGREKLHKDIDIDRTIGWFTSIYPVVLELDKDIRETIITTKEMLRRVPNHGMSYGVLKYISQSVDAVEVNLSFNYLGEITEGREENKGLIAMSEYWVGEERSGENDLGIPIMIDGQISNGQLAFMFTYDSGKFEKDYIRLLADEYENTLKEVVRYCTSSKEKIKTASDFDKVKLSQKTFSKIESLLSQI